MGRTADRKRGGPRYMGVVSTWICFRGTPGRAATAWVAYIYSKVCATRATKFNRDGMKGGSFAAAVQDGLRPTLPRAHAAGNPPGPSPRPAWRLGVLLVHPLICEQISSRTLLFHSAFSQ